MRNQVKRSKNTDLGFLKVGHILAATPTLSPDQGGPSTKPHQVHPIELQDGSGGEASGDTWCPPQRRRRIPALNSCPARARNHVTSPPRSSLVAPPPPLKRQPRESKCAPTAGSYPGTDCNRQLPGSLVFQRTGRGGRSVTSGSRSQPFLPPPYKVALATRSMASFRQYFRSREAGSGQLWPTSVSRPPKLRDRSILSSLSIKFIWCKSGGCGVQRKP